MLNAQIDPAHEEISVPDEPCVTCTIVQYCGTPQCINPLYELTAQLRRAWGNIAQEYNKHVPDFPLRSLDCALVLGMFIAGEIDYFPQEVLTSDCADMAEYFCRYVRLIQKQTAMLQEHSGRVT